MFVRQLVLATLAAVVLAPGASALTMSYAGTQYDVGGTFFPGGGPADVQNYHVAGWRGNDVAKTLDLDGNDVYGSAGYALFGTRFDYPNANATGGNAFVNPTDNSVYPNIIDLPSWVAGHQILSSRKAGGWAYALIDDPQLTNGARDFNWGASQIPASTFQAPYVKLGVLDGTGIVTQNDPTVAPAERWGFALGPDAPSKIRVGVMTDGLDSEFWAPSEVLMQHTIGGVPMGAPVSTGTVAKNRFIDMHFFDIIDGQAGDEFVFLASNPGGGSAGIAGFTFEAIPEPSTLAIVGVAMFGGAALWRRRR
ncbi:PEP-CTERM sorting domain-containing protein [Aeoliella sp.]|uniref:PEP-CTERM sorting domain-containing protein n=1 Tax=Aeoliella sp. TaxID=2795800 RepID=UPI003CCB848D